MSCDLSNSSENYNPFSFEQTSGGGRAAACAAPAAAAAPAASAARATSAAPAASQEQTLSGTRGFIDSSEFDNKYRIDFKVKPDDSGTFGEVYFGVVKATGLPVAVKKINSRPTPKNPKCSLERTIEEAKAAMLFDSPNLCKVYDFSVDDAGFVYIVMERIIGTNAFDYLLESFKKKILLGKKNPLLVRRIICDVARGLVTLHVAGFAHRDIKLDNIMLEFDESGEFKRAVIIDFGFLMRVSEIPPSSQQGSICYSAPEIVQKGVLSEMVDIWAVGVMLFVSLHGYYPIWSNNQDPIAEAYEIYQKLQNLTESPELPLYTEGDKDVNHLRMICARCLGFDSSARISAEELLAMLS
jgi:doublecortin-like kinase 1/2